MSATVKVVLKKSGKLIGEAEVSETKSKVTAGKGSGVDLQITSDGLPDSFPILMIHQEKTFLAIPQNLTEGFVEKKGKKVDLKDLISAGFGKESQGMVWVVVDDTAGGSIKINDYEVLFGKLISGGDVTQKQTVTSFKESGGNRRVFTEFAGVNGLNMTIPPFHSVKLKSFKVYLYILLASLILNVGGMIFVGLVNLPDESSDISAIPARFAKLIVDDIPKPDQKVAEGEKESSDQKQVAQEENKEEETTTSDKKAATGKVDEKERIKKLKEKVRRVGVLAIISSKGGGGVIQDVISNSGVGDLDTALSKVGGVTTAGTNVDLAAIKKTRVGGAAKSASIGSLGVGPGQKVSLGEKKVKRVVASINLGGGKISGNISGSVVRNVVKRNIRGVKYCYEKELRRNPKLQGKVTILFTISPVGRISKAKVQNSTIKNKNVESCIVRMVLRWRFPPPKNKKSVTVSYPFIFAPGS